MIHYTQRIQLLKDHMIYYTQRIRLLKDHMIHYTHRIELLKDHMIHHTQRIDKDHIRCTELRTIIWILEMHPYQKSTKSRSSLNLYTEVLYVYGNCVMLLYNYSNMRYYHYSHMTLYHVIM